MKGKHDEERNSEEDFEERREQVTEKILPMNNLEFLAALTFPYNCKTTLPPIHRSFRVCSLSMYNYTHCQDTRFENLIKVII